MTNKYELCDINILNFSSIANKFWGKSLGCKSVDITKYAKKQKN